MNRNTDLQSMNDYDATLGNANPRPFHVSRLRAQLIKGAAGSFVLQVGFAGLSFLTAVVLARLLGAEGYGAFTNAMAWVSMLTIPATFGIGILLVRDIAIYRSQEQWSLLVGLLRFADHCVLLLSIVLALLAAILVGYMFSSEEQAVLRHTLWIALGLLPLFAINNVRESALRGLEYVVYAQLSGMLVRPGLLLGSVACFYFFWQDDLSVTVAMLVNLGAGTVALLLSIHFLHQRLPFQAKTAVPEYTRGYWLKAAIPMMIYGGSQSVLGLTDIVMLGAMKGAQDVGVYAAANRLAFLLGYSMLAAEMILAPVAARLYKSNERMRLQDILTKSTRISFFSVLPLGVVYIFFGESILSIFGMEFIIANEAFIILTIGRLFHVAMGPGALLLSMTGHEKYVARVIGFSVLLNAVLNAVMITFYGINGAAIASILTLIIMRASLSYHLMKVTGLNVTLLKHHLVWSKR